MFAPQGPQYRCIQPSNSVSGSRFLQTGQRSLSASSFICSFNLADGVRPFFPFDLAGLTCDRLLSEEWAAVGGLDCTGTSEAPASDSAAAADEVAPSAERVALHRFSRCFFWCRSVLIAICTQQHSTRAHSHQPR